MSYIFAKENTGTNELKHCNSDPISRKAGEVMSQSAFPCLVYKYSCRLCRCRDMCSIFGRHHWVDDSPSWYS